MHRWWRAHYVRAVKCSGVHRLQPTVLMRRRTTGTVILISVEKSETNSPAVREGVCLEERPAPQEVTKRNVSNHGTRLRHSLYC